MANEGEKMSSKSRPDSKKPTSPRKGKKRKEKKNDADKDETKIVTVGFNGHQYTGIVRTDTLGKRTLDAPTATYAWSDGLKYEGPFVASEITGHGKLLWPDGSKYEGAVSNGKRHGEGVYLAADGVTKYEGQWFEGKRHGKGQLTFDKEGESFYLGEWKAGCKHGQGCQVWPSKNTYEGQWRSGRMHGNGTMTWYDSGILEKYTGQWEDDLPQGEGKHVWHAPDLTRQDVGGMREMPSQQSNNSYQGQWVAGVRSGYGTFNFASGAMYQGQWVDNVKQGEGRYTYEDGNVYSGQFVGDNMAEPGASRYQSSSINGAVNVGGEDNPVRRCMDITDLEGFCLPTDRVADATERSGYSEPGEVFREIYNILLRNMGDLKKIYAQLRKSFQKPGDDPWVVSTQQFWTLAREAGLVSPDCPLSRLDRHIMNGPRHHLEACPTDLQELRPLTPRQAPVPTPAHEATRTGSKESLRKVSKARLDTVREGMIDGNALLEDEEEEYEEDDEEAESLADMPENEDEEERQPSRTSFRESVAGHGEEEACDQGLAVDSPKSGVSRASGFHPAIDVHVRHSRFWRREDSSYQEAEFADLKLVDIHSATSTLMFRHFLEAIVRMSLACFPDSQGLESMVKALLKDRLLPLVAEPSDPGSTRIFSYLLDEGILQVFATFRPTLWELFKHHAAGDGAYKRPLWAAPHGADDDDDDESADHGRGNRQLRRHFGGVQRRVHVRARMDVTIRVKDALHVLDRAGLLAIGNVELQGQDPKGTIFPERMPRPNTTSTAGTTPLDDLAGLELEGLMPTAPGTANYGGAGEEEPAALLASNMLGGGVSRLVAQDSGGEESRAETPATQAPAADDPAQQFLKSNFRADFLRVLDILTEVSLPDLTTRVRWSLDRGAPVEHVALLDFLETELTFVEFQRLLLGLADLPSRTDGKNRLIEFPQCLEMFLQQVFLPALDSPYVPPPPSTAEAAKKDAQRSEAQEAEDAADVPAAEGADVAEGGDAADGKEAGADEAHEDLTASREFWHGFCDPDDLEVSCAATPRAWPEDYAEEVAAW